MYVSGCRFSGGLLVTSLGLEERLVLIEGSFRKRGVEIEPKRSSIAY